MSLITLITVTILCEFLKSAFFLEFGDLDINSTMDINKSMEGIVYKNLNQENDFFQTGLSYKHFILHKNMTLQ